jgi:tetratricopeptide (TPR) repeat protein
VDERFAPAARRPTTERRATRSVESGEPSAPRTRSEPSVPRIRNATNLIAATAEPIEVRRSDAARPVSPLLSGAYQSFVSGDTPAARSQYQRLLQQEPDNRDALLGMAAIALNRGQQAEAGSFYTRLLELDPADPEAAAGMASVQRGDPALAESRLKGVLAASPENGPALFALGNVYAQQARWAEAQQAYFRALGSEPNNAGYAFNLAVSLDKLTQPKLALEYYRRTLQLVGSGGASVNLRAVRERIAQLERAR